MKTACVYHSIDLDGWMSAAIVKHWFNLNEALLETMAREPGMEGIPINTIDFFGYNYGQPIPSLQEYQKVIMCDISFPIEEMEKLRQNLQDNFIWIDHHISAIKATEERTNTFYEGLRDIKFAACELTWKYFFPNRTMPAIVRALGMYDSFRHKGTDEEINILEFQYGARQRITNCEEAYSVISMPFGHQDTFLWDTLEKGKAIYQYLCTDAKQSYKNGFDLLLADTTTNEEGEITSGKLKRFICINKERFNPINFGIDYHKDKYDGAACFHIDCNGIYCFSLYNDNGLVDCSQIAKQYGGGGHKGAAGFRLNLEQYTNLIKFNKI